MTKSSTGLDSNIAGALCYSLGWFTGLIFLLIEKESDFVKFHARQSIAVFGLFTVASIIVPAIPFIGFLLSKIIGAAGFVAWILLMVFAAQEKEVRVPVASDLADKLV